jgi:hypothetical protein
MIINDNYILLGGDWNMNFIFHFIYGMSSFPLTHIFQDGYCRGFNSRATNFVTQTLQQVKTLDATSVIAWPRAKRYTHNQQLA